MEGKGAGWAQRVGRSGSGLWCRGGGGGLRGAGVVVGWLGGEGLPGVPVVVVWGRRRGQGLSVEQLQGSVQKREVEAESGSYYP